MKQLAEGDVKNIVQGELQKSQYKVGGVPYHTHNKIDSAPISYKNLTDLPTTSSSISGRSHNPATTSIPVNSGASPQLLDFSTNDFANGITWNGTNHTFVCVTLGIYLVGGSCFLAAGNTSGVELTTFSIYKNGLTGTLVSYSQQPNAGNLGEGGSSGCSDLVSLAVADTISFYITTSGNDAKNITTSSSATYGFITLT